MDDRFKKNGLIFFSGLLGSQDPLKILKLKKLLIENSTARIPDSPIEKKFTPEFNIDWGEHGKKNKKD